MKVKLVNILMVALLVFLTENSFAREMQKDLIYVKKTIYCCNFAANISNGSGRVLTSKETENYISAYKDAYGHAALVNTANLNRIYPQFGNNFEVLRSGLEMLLQGYSNNDNKKIQIAQQSFIAWAEWFNRNLKGISQLK